MVNRSTVKLIDLSSNRLDEQNYQLFNLSTVTIQLIDLIKDLIVEEGWIAFSLLTRGLKLNFRLCVSQKFILSNLFSDVLFLWRPLMLQLDTRLMIRTLLIHYTVQQAK